METNSHPESIWHLHDDDTYQQLTTFKNNLLHNIVKVEGIPDHQETIQVDLLVTQDEVDTLQTFYLRHRLSVNTAIG